MKRALWSLAGPLFPLVCVGLAGWSPASRTLEDDEAHALARTVRERVESLRRVRDERARLEDEERFQREDERSRTEALDDALRALRATRDRLQAEVDTLARDLEEPARVLAEAEAYLEEFRAAALPLVAKLERRVAQGIPQERAFRMARLKSVADVLSEEPATWDAGSLSELWSWASDELRRARTIEYWNESVTLDGGQRRLPAYRLRFGLVDEAALSEDLGWVARANAGQETWDDGLDAPMAEALIRALRILQRQEPPGLLPIPLRDARGS